MVFRFTARFGENDIDGYDRRIVLGDDFESFGKWPSKPQQAFVRLQALIIDCKDKGC